MKLTGMCMVKNGNTRVEMLISILVNRNITASICGIYGDGFCKNVEGCLRRKIQNKSIIVKFLKMIVVKLFKRTNVLFMIQRCPLQQILQGAHVAIL